MKITIEIDEEIIRNAVGQAHIYFWADENRGSWNKETLQLKIYETDPDDGSDGLISLTRNTFAQGLGVMATKYPHAFAMLVSGSGDMYTAGLFIQCCAFGEEKYA